MIDGFLDAGSAPDFCKVKLWKLFAGQRFNRSAQSRFHHTAGSAEDYACAGAKAQRFIKALIRQIQKTDACFLNHPRQLSGSDGYIHIRNAGGVLVISSDFKFFRRTRHNAYTYNVSGINSHLFGIVGFGDCSKHLLRRLASGEMLCHIREIVLAVFDPAGRAGGDHGQNAAVFYTL